MTVPLAFVPSRGWLPGDPAPAAMYCPLPSLGTHSLGTTPSPPLRYKEGSVLGQRKKPPSSWGLKRKVSWEPSATHRPQPQLPPVSQSGRLVC